MNKIKIGWVSGVFIIAIMMTACAGTGGLGGNSGSMRTYQKDFDAMKDIVRKVIRGNNLNIDQVSESDDKKEITFVITTNKFVNNQSVRQNRGTVTVKKNNAQKTSVQVENPDYHFSVPEHQRENYQRMIFARLDGYKE